MFPGRACSATCPAQTTGDAGPVVVLATVLLKAEQQAAQERRNQEAEEAFIAAMQRLQTTVECGPGHNRHTFSTMRILENFHFEFCSQIYHFGSPAQRSANPQEKWPEAMMVF